MGASNTIVLNCPAATERRRRNDSEKVKFKTRLKAHIIGATTRMMSELLSPPVSVPLTRVPLDTEMFAAEMFAAEEKARTMTTTK